MVICVLFCKFHTGSPPHLSSEGFCQTPIAQSYKIANKLRNFFQP